MLKLELQDAATACARGEGKEQYQLDSWTIVSNECVRLFRTTFMPLLIFLLISKILIFETWRIIVDKNQMSKIIVFILVKYSDIRINMYSSQ